MMRLFPCEDPSAWGGAKRSKPTTVSPRRDSSRAAAEPMAPRPAIATSYVRDMAAHGRRASRRSQGRLVAPSLSAERGLPELAAPHAELGDGGVIRPAIVRALAQVERRARH